MHAVPARALLLVLATLYSVAGATDYPTNIGARIAQRDDFGVKLKVNYHINSDHSSSIEMRVKDFGPDFTTPGATCGGFPRGCAVAKGASVAEVLYDLRTVSVAFRVNAGEWSEYITFSKNGKADSPPLATRGASGVVQLQQVTNVRQEL